MESMPDWSGLPPELLVEIAIRVGSAEDFMALRGVCTFWRAAVGMDKVAAVIKRWLPLLMLADKEDGSDEREFYSLSKRKICMSLPLPEAKRKRCVEAGFGWVFTVSSTGDANLLNPLTRAQIQLPHFRGTPFLSCAEFCFITRAVLSANLSASDDVDVDVVLTVCGGLYLGFWRPGDENWTRIYSGEGGFANIRYYQGKLYAIKYSGSVMVWDPSTSSTSTPVADEIFTVDLQLLIYRMTYFVESSFGELLLITRDGYQVEGDGVSYGVTNFGVIRLDVTKRRWEEIPTTTGLGKDAIFIGDNAAISVAVDAASSEDDVIIIKPNCIYFTDDCTESYHALDDDDEDEDEDEGRTRGEGGGKDTGIYNVEDGKIERFADVNSLSFIRPPLWVTHH